MIAFLNPPLTPRNGHTLEVLVACRVSDPKPGKQDERSLADQEAEHREWIERNTDLPCNIKVVAGSGSGESVERSEYLDLIELVESRKFDVVLTEDLGRILRRLQAHMFCELCVDNDVRLIALNDNVDTAHDGWEDRSIFSAWHHERSNRDTSGRIKRTHRNRFQHGGCLALPIAGYRKPPGAKGDDDLEKVPEFEEIYKEWFRRLDEDEATFAEIADWLNEQGVPTGEYCRQKQWTGTMVGRVTRNWLLKGIRFRNKRRSRRNNKSGKYRTEKAPPEDLLTRPVPHLAFFDEAYYDRVVEKANLRNAKYRRKGADGQDPRRNQPRKRTRYPGQSVYCGICGRLYVYGGHGRKDHLMCSGAREHRCWNGTTFDGPMAAERLSEAIYVEIEALPAFDGEFLALLEEEVALRGSSRDAELRANLAESQRVEHEMTNIVGAIRDYGSSDILLAELKRLEQSQSDLAVSHHELKVRSADRIEIPSLETVKQVARQEFARLAKESHEYARLMRKLIPMVYVFPFRLCDGGAIVLRASLTFTAVPLVPGSVAQLAGLGERLTKQIFVDLFDPPQRAAFRERVVQMRAAGMKEREVAEELQITVTAASRAARLQRLMASLDITDPWLPVREPPADYGKFRRHLHHRYCFRPLDGFPRDWPH